MLIKKKKINKYIDNDFKVLPKKKKNIDINVNLY